MLRTMPMDFSQGVLINHINDYQKLKGRELISTYGYCQGLALVWMQKMLEKKVEWFYNTVKGIVTLSPKDYDVNNIDIEKFLAMIEWAQWSSEYDPTVTQIHLKKILDMRNIQSYDFFGTHHELYRNMRPRRHPAMYFIGTPLHGVAVFHFGGFYHVYDCNYTSGKAKVLDCKKKAANEIIDCLIDKTELSVNKKFNLELHAITLKGLLLHPADEVVIDIGDDYDNIDEGYEADADEYIGDSFLRCSIL